MHRRRFLATAGCTFSIPVVGCLSKNSSEPTSEIAFIELENHRRDEPVEFTVRIERDDMTVFEATPRLEPAGSGNSTAVFEQPVAESGSYTVYVEADGHTASPNTAKLVSESETCLGLQFYLDTQTLHWEHRAYQRCGTTENDRRAN